MRGELSGSHTTEPNIERYFNIEKLVLASVSLCSGGTNSLYTSVCCVLHILF